MNPLLVLQWCSYSSVHYFENILNILSVTMNPPTTFIVARIKAANPRIVAVVGELWGIDSNAPKIVIPEIAFAPDINGVCRVGGIFVMISKPTNTARTNAVIKDIISVNFKRLISSDSVLYYKCRINNFILFLKGNLDLVLLI